MKDDVPVNRFQRTIAVTGVIGAGKSRVAQWLARECDFFLFDADEEVRLLLDPGGQGWRRLRAWLGAEYFGADGTLLKAKLRQKIFADEAVRHLVERDLHPLVLANLQAKTKGKERPCLVEVPLLYEVQWQGYFDSVVVVYAVESICRDRVMARDRVSGEQVMASIHAQMPIEQKVRLADFAVDNSGDWSATLQQLAGIKKMLSQKYLKKKLDSRDV